ncbi:hypothetical protein LPJ66_000699 [Kickxella alabastrina]|uniref:Uncharacterized protein n=1 Tax=Kickxella alabastrina TaxID=61397 RepID=A0ACC1IVB0_9FUNG|nr:hypothetical protein LPJ66_000699 [Kickxella alabastrina]
MQSSLNSHLRSGRRVISRLNSTNSTRPLGSLLCNRNFHASVNSGKDEDAASKSPASWPTAESVILKRISSTGLHPSLSHLKTGKELVAVSKGTEKDADSEGLEKAEGTEGVGGEDGSAVGGSILSVSGIINSIREKRAASQQQPQQQRVSDPRTDSADTGVHRQGSDLHDPLLPYFLFDTYSLVHQLMECGFSRAQATTLTTLIKHKVYEGMEQVNSGMLTKSDLENDAYLFRAALQELRTETQMIRKNDQAILESQAAAINRDIDSLAQRTHDEIANLRSDIEIELNNHKHDTNHEMKSLDMELHELSSKYQVIMGEMKTDIEAIKLDSIRRGLITAVVTTLFVTALIWAPDILENMKNKSKLGVKAGGSADGSDDERRGGLGVGGSSGKAASQRSTGAGRAGTSRDSQVLAPLPYSTSDDSAMPSADHSGRSIIGDDSADNSSQLRYRDHSHLNIHYDPTISPADEQLNASLSQQQRPRHNVYLGRQVGDISSAEPPEGYDDWFDSFFYSPQGVAKHQNGSERSASLMDSDSKLDTTFWNSGDQGIVGDSGASLRTAGSGLGRESGSESRSESRAEDNNGRPNTSSSEARSNTTITTIPLHFTYSDNAAKPDNSDSKSA